MARNRYHVPRSFLQRGGNTLVLFEEVGGDPTHISFAKRHLGSLCGHVSELHPPSVDAWNLDGPVGIKSGAVLRLECPYPNQVIASIKFASFGTPLGTCGSFKHGRCRSENALSVVQKVCKFPSAFSQSNLSSFSYFMIFHRFSPWDLIGLRGDEELLRQCLVRNIWRSL